MSEIKEDFLESSDGSSMTSKLKNFSMKESTAGREKIDNVADRMAKGLDVFSVLGQFRKKKREEIKQRFENAGIDLTNIDIDQAFRMLTRGEAVFAGFRRMLTTVPRAFIRTSQAVSRVGMGVITAPKYIVQGLATIPTNLKDTVITHATDESKGYIDRWKGIVKSAARTVYQPFTKPGAAFVGNRAQDIKDAFKAGKSLLATITINPFKRTIQGLQKPPHQIAAAAEKKQKKIEAKLNAQVEADHDADLANEELQKMLSQYKNNEEMAENNNQGEEQFSQIQEDSGELEADNEGRTENKQV